MMPATSLETGVRWSWDWPVWATAMLVAAAVAWVVLLYAREQSFVSKRRRTMLAVLRLVAVALAGLMLAQPTIERRRVARPRLALLVDRSASMETRDVVAADLPADGNAKTSPDTKLARRTAWERLLLGENESLLQQLRAKYGVDVVFFDATAQRIDLTPSTPPTQLRHPKSSNGAANESPATGTRLGDAINYALRQLGGPSPAAVVVMTDGVSTAGLSLSDAAERARTMGVPIYAVALGSDRPRPDTSIGDALVETIVFPGDRLQVEASLAATGFQGKPARVTLKDIASNDVRAETQAELPANGAKQTIRVALRPLEPGPLRLELALDPQPGEDDVANNRTELTVDVRSEPIRALLVDSTPRFEYRALKSLLERDPAIELDVWLQDADANYAAVDDAALRDFPPQAAELQQYDVVLLGDVDPDLLPRQAWSNLLAFVSEHGGGLAVIAGERFMPNRFADVGAMRVLLPIEAADANSLRANQRSALGFPIEPTPIGLTDASLQLGETAQQSAAVWAALPSVLWLLESPDIKPGAEVLAVHPLRSAAGGEPLPIILRHYVGAGSVLMHTTDETWRWRWRSDDRYFARYWGQAVRRLARGRAMRGHGSLSTVRQEYAVGEAVLVRAQLRPTSLGDRDAIAVQLESDNSASREIRLPRMASRADAYELALRDLPPDSYTVRLTGEGMAPLSTSFVVVAPPGEMVDLVVNTAGLAAAAETTGGKWYTAMTAHKLPKELPPARPTAVEQLPDEPLWNSPWLLGGFCVALGAEWLLRRRAGML